MQNAPPFIDWITVRRSSEIDKPLPVLFRGIQSYHDAAGRCLFERVVAQRVSGSFESSIAVQSDGRCFLVSGNVGRFDREDNVFNHRVRGTKSILHRICLLLGFPDFGTVAGSNGVAAAVGSIGNAQATVSRLDLTKNFALGSEAQARKFIESISGLAISRTKRGLAGDEAVWWSNSRRMVKVYRKAAELVAHGMAEDHPLVVWCRDIGLVRVEVEFKNRLLFDLNMQNFDELTDEKCAAAYDGETAFLSRFDSSDEPDILAQLPASSRVYAAAWLAGQDLSNFVSRATLYRHGKILRPFGLDVMTKRDILRFPTKVRVIELRELEAPDWYDWGKAA